MLNACTGCMACADRCAKEAITIQDSLGAYNAVIDEHRCVGCGACEAVCPNLAKPSLHKPIEWHEGWAPERLRARSSSGGVTSALMENFMHSGGYVAACAFKNGTFRFELTNNPARIAGFAGSKYVKSNPEGIYLQVARRLRSGDKVLFIGLPCQVAAAKNFTSGLPEQLRENLYTVDLICHGTPSPRILERFLAERGVRLSDLEEIHFRDKNRYGLFFRQKGRSLQRLLPERVQDLYMYAFLTSLDYTENCYSCRYATLERVSDITLGDSWGSRLSAEEQSKGVSLVLCQTEKGKELLTLTQLELKEVDLERAVQANRQLHHPSVVPAGRKRFLAHLDRGVQKAIAYAEPKVYIKQKIKELLIKAKLLPEK